MRLSAWTIFISIICLGIAISSFGGPIIPENADLLWRYTNMPPDGREELLIEESRQVAESRANFRQSFEKEELIRILNEAALRHGVEPELLCAIAWVESRFHPYIESNMGARGLMQLMPNTAARLGVRNPMNPVDSAEGGARLFRWLLEEYDNDLALALAAYNAGTGAVKRGGRIPPFSQTRQFITQVLTMRDHFRNRPGEPPEEVLDSFSAEPTAAPNNGTNASPTAPETEPAGSPSAPSAGAAPTATAPSNAAAPPVEPQISLLTKDPMKPKVEMLE